MTDLSTILLNQNLMNSALDAANSSGAINLNNKLSQNNTNSPAEVNTTKEQGVYAVKGDHLYKEEMDINTDGVITNAEMSQYYAQLDKDYGNGLSSIQSKTVSNVVTTAQAANAYAANETGYAIPYTSLIEKYA